MFSKARAFFGFLFLVFLIAAVSSVVTMPNTNPSTQPNHILCPQAEPRCDANWYNSLHKPAWQPPAWAFGPVWTILYIMIAVSGWLVWRRLPTERFWQKLTSLIMAPYWLQLALNFLWSIFFFGMHRPILSLIDIALLAITIGMNIGTFRKVNTTAAYLLAPYFAWVCYAISLNAAIVFLN